MIVLDREVENKFNDEEFNKIIYGLISVTVLQDQNEIKSESSEVLTMDKGLLDL